MVQNILITGNVFQTQFIPYEDYKDFTLGGLEKVLAAAQADDKITEEEKQDYLQNYDPDYVKIFNSGERERSVLVSDLINKDNCEDNNIELKFELIGGLNGGARKRRRRTHHRAKARRTHHRRVGRPRGRRCNF